MISARLSEADFYCELLDHDLWRVSFDWLRKLDTRFEEGIYTIDPTVSESWFANAHSYDTRAADRCVWENHRHTIDLQFLHQGQETIRWGNRDAFGDPERYIKGE